MECMEIMHLEKLLFVNFLKDLFVAISSDHCYGFSKYLLVQCNLLGVCTSINITSRATCSWRVKIMFVML